MKPIYALFASLIIFVVTTCQEGLADGQVNQRESQAAVEHDSSSTAKRLISFNKQLEVSYYGAWKSGIRIEGGRLILRGIKASGGCSRSEKLDLANIADYSLALKLKTGTGNTAKSLCLQFGFLEDFNGPNTVWEFPLPPMSETFTIVTPLNCAPFAKPNSFQDKRGNALEKPAFDLSQIRCWMLRGDFGKGDLDVEIEEVLALPPDAKMLAERDVAAKEEAKKAEALAKKAKEDAAKLAKEQEEMLLKYSQRGPSSPEVDTVSMISDSIISLTIDAQKVILPKFEKYEPQPGDEKRIEKWADGVVRRAKLVRGGKEIGWLQGKNLDWFSTFERLDGDPLLYFLAENPANYELSSKDDLAYATHRNPVAVFRKSMPTDELMTHTWSPQGTFPVRHRLYLKLAQKLTEGKSYKVQISSLNVKNPDLEFVYDSRLMMSEAVHVNQIGFRPDDPGKRAFLSVWLGSGGAMTYPEGLRFSLIDESSSKDVFSGSVDLIFPANARTDSPCNKAGKNDTGTAVYKMDFSDFKAQGRYRVHVEGIGRSYPFEIGPSTWENALSIQLKGLYNQRGGVELGPPYTEFKKPRDFHPADGAMVTRSTCDLSMAKTEAEGYALLAKGDTGETVPSAWGGYHDAGDWNPRRVSHMGTTMAQLELFELFPGYCKALALSIPHESGIPDILTEALFELDCFRRLQLSDGAIPAEIETNGDPSPGEISWLSTMHCYVSAPTNGDSWQYAAVAARASRLLNTVKPDLASIYLESAKKAFAWAEADYAKRKIGAYKWANECWRATDFRNLSALILYDATGDRKYHDIFLENTCLKTPGQEVFNWGKWLQCDAAFYYAKLDDAKADPDIKKNAIATIIRQADRSLEYQAGNPFGIAQEDKARGRVCGFYSSSGGAELARAHFLSGKPEYLTGIVRSCQFQSGCNPNNIVYTSGLGANPVKHPLHLDSRSTGQLPPVGLTTMGNADLRNNVHNKFHFWKVPYLNKPSVCYPQVLDWPVEETYFDIYMWPSMNEFVIEQWAPNVLVWGYLAARPASP